MYDRHPIDWQRLIEVEMEVQGNNTCHSFEFYIAKHCLENMEEYMLQRTCTSRSSLISNYNNISNSAHLNYMIGRVWSRKLVQVFFGRFFVWGGCFGLIWGTCVHFIPLYLV